MSNKHKTVNASPASYEILTEIRDDAERDLGITVSLSEAIQLSGAAYFELKRLKQKAKAAREAREVQS